VRETSGLAMSSRNLRLSDEEKTKAAGIFKTLEFIRDNIRPGELDALKTTAVTRLSTLGFKVDYVEIAQSGTLQPVGAWNGKDPLVALIAASINEVRLIDNLLLQNKAAIVS
jgi:pantoate--beta-alanine ligase